MFSKQTYVAFPVATIRYRKHLCNVCVPVHLFTSTLQLLVFQTSEALALVSMTTYRSTTSPAPRPSLRLNISNTILNHFMIWPRSSILQSLRYVASHPHTLHTPHTHSCLTHSTPLTYSTAHPLPLFHPSP